MRIFLMTFALGLCVQFVFAQNQNTGIEQYCVIELRTYYSTNKWVEELRLIKPDGEIEITKLDSKSSVKESSLFILLLNKLGAEGWTAVNSTSANNATSSTYNVLMKRTQ
ncbi:MAG TPA: hypothetical protein VNW06_09590 [Cytophagaceae bacterium]|jgi:hypothetical protein|nr:hypothetical protein [Cytophagaceae bacterium]